jgi:xanthine/CO dehydrogenase XdhC/CoxF family maturation factor
MSVNQIIKTFDAWRGDGQPMVLATVYETIGSTYSKAGHRILIAASGQYQGLVSGGCLEGDLAERARTVVEANQASSVTYDMRGEADELFGLGVGCDGLIRVLLQPLLPSQDYQPFASIARHLLANRPAAVATVIESARPTVPPGATVIVQGSSREAWNIDQAIADRLAKECARILGSGQAYFTNDESGLGVLYASLKPVPKLLLLGAGLDAIPLVNMAADLGWRVTVMDHRPAYLERGGFERAERTIHVVPRRLAETVPLAEFDAIIVMSHHLVTDRTYLSQLAGVGARYLGVLGPPARKDRLLAGLGETGSALRGELKGPVGLDIGADSPESIALSILAELQATLSGATAKSLTGERAVCTFSSWR